MLYWIRFELDKHYEVINRILSAKLLFIQPRKKGESLLATHGVPKILLGIPSVGFEEDWKKVYRKIQQKRFKNIGVERKELDEMIEIFNREWESVVNKHI